MKVSLNDASQLAGQAGGGLCLCFEIPSMCLWVMIYKLYPMGGVRTNPDSDFQLRYILVLVLPPYLSLSFAPLSLSPSLSLPLPLSLSLISEEISQITKFLNSLGFESESICVIHLKVTDKSHFSYGKCAYHGTDALTFKK